MRKNFGAKPLTYPQPAYIIGSYDENGQPDAMMAAWGGISARDEISCCISRLHKTTENILKSREFTVSIATEAQLKACDFVGIVSANKQEDKFSKSGFHHQKAEFVNAPLIEELPMCLECKLISYDEEREILRAKIVNVSADESILSDGKIDPEKLRPIVFDPVNMLYWGLGEKLGQAFSDGKELLG